MTFAEYLDRVRRRTSLVHNSERMGQAYYNQLHEDAPDIAKAVKDTACDPFYEDDKIPAFLTIVCEAWKH
jgi:hypothetical protein